MVCKNERLIKVSNYMLDDLESTVHYPTQLRQRYMCQYRISFVDIQRVVWSVEDTDRRTYNSGLSDTRKQILR